MDFDETSGVEDGARGQAIEMSSRADLILYIYPLKLSIINRAASSTDRLVLLLLEV